MRRSVFSVLAALALVPIVGGSVAVAAAPVAPRYADATSVQWDVVTDEMGTWCQLTANAVLDRPMGGGERVFGRVWVHERWIAFDGVADPWYEWDFVGGRLGHGTDAFAGTISFDISKYGHYEVDWVRFELRYRLGEVYDSKVVNTAYGC